MSPIGIEYQPPLQKGKPDQPGEPVAWINDPLIGKTKNVTIPLLEGEKHPEYGTLDKIVAEVTRYPDGFFEVYIAPHYQGKNNRGIFLNQATRVLRPVEGFWVDITEGVSAKYSAEIPPGTPLDKIF